MKQWYPATIGHITLSKLHEICLSAILNQISTKSMHSSSLMKIHRNLLKSFRTENTDRRIHGQTFGRTDEQTYGPSRWKHIPRYYSVAGYEKGKNLSPRQGRQFFPHKMFHFQKGSKRINTVASPKKYLFLLRYSRLPLSRIPRGSMEYFEIPIPRHIRFAELRKIEQTHLTNIYIYVIRLEARDTYILKILWKRGVIAP